LAGKTASAINEGHYSRRWLQQTAILTRLFRLSRHPLPAPLKRRF
jgi:hypothetical protein